MIDSTDRQSLDQALSELYALHEMAKLLASSIEQTEVVGYILDCACGLLGTESSFVYGHQADRQALELLGTQGPDLELPEIVSCSGDHWIAQAAQAPSHSTLTHDGLSLAIVPLWAHDKTQGVMGVGTRTTRQFTPAELTRLGDSSYLAAMALESARLYARIQTLAITDGLTGLYNHRHFFDQLNREMARAWRLAQPLSLLILDIDHFKHFNDTFGHVRGDEVLHTVGRILQENTRRFDLAARYGGEEFAVILSNSDTGQAQLVAERMRAHVGTTTFHEHFAITISVGIASLGCEPGESAQEFAHRADMALYHAKQTGRNRVCVYEYLDAQENT